MENVKQKTWHSIDVTGRWQLKYRVENPQGPQAFGGYLLTKYPNPFTGEDTYLKDVNNRAKPSYMIAKIVTTFKPDFNPNERFLVSWMLCHPEVKVEGVELDEEIMRAKLTNSKITLTWLDHAEVHSIDDEDYIDIVISKITLNRGKETIGLKKLRWINAQLGIVYMDPRFKGEAEKKMLRSRLKSYIRNSVENAKVVENMLSNLSEAQEWYEFKELVRLKVLSYSDGIYRFKSASLGSNFATVQAFFVNHPEVKSEVLKLMYDQLK